MNNLLPFIESNNFYENLDSIVGSNNKDLLINLYEDGYCIFDLNIKDEIIDEANEDINKVLASQAFKTNSAAYHYNDSPRIVEGWKFSNAIKEIATHDNIINFLRIVYQSEPIPFSTINFLKGTEQPLHSDEFHFGSIPHRYLTGIWIALEDIDPNSGPLSLAAKSHRLPIFSFERIGIGIPKTEKEFKSAYTMYEDWVRGQIEKNNLKIVTPKLKKGQCLVWLSNVLHGSYEIKDRSLSRKSLVVHYHYEACKKIFFPSYSNLEKKRFVPRQLNDLDIRKK